MRPADRYGDTGYRRMLLAPGLLAAVLLFVGIGLVGQEFYQLITWAIAVLALICVVLLAQAKLWWWTAPFIAIAVLWNPLIAFDIDSTVWMLMHYVAISVFIAAGLLVKVKIKPEDMRR